MRVRGKLTTPSAVVVRAVLLVLAAIRASRISRHRFGLNVVDTHWVIPGASLCVERKKLTAGKPVNSCFAA